MSKPHATRLVVRKQLNQNNLRVQSHYKKLDFGSKIDSFELEVTKIAQCGRFWTDRYALWKRRRLTKNAGAIQPSVLHCFLELSRFARFSHEVKCRLNRIGVI